MFTDPLKNLKAFGIKETDIIADLGAGTGFYSILAAQIANKGKVYAVEISKDFLEVIRNKAKEIKLENLECFWGNVEKIGGTKIGDAVVDKVIVSNVFFQIIDKDNFIEEVKRILKQKGRVLFIDWSPSSSIAHKDHIVPQEKAREMFEKKGFILDREIDAGEHHYGMIFTKG